MIYRFLPNFGKYMLNVLNEKSNGEEKDRAWAWKSGTEWEEARERAAALRRELRDVRGEWKCDKLALEGVGGKRRTQRTLIIVI